MRHHLFSPPKDSPVYKIALLIKDAAFSKAAIEQNYVYKLVTSGVPAEDLIAFTLSYAESNKAPVAHIKEYLSKLLPALDSLGTTHLYVADANYFKVLTSSKRAEPNFGYVLPCTVKGFEHMKVVLGLNHQALLYDPSQQPKLDMSLETLIDELNGKYTQLGAGIIHTAQYPKSLDGIREALTSLHQYPTLTCDIETFSLRFWEAGIGTISFAWDQHNGIAFPCDYFAFADQDPDTKDYGSYLPNEPVRRMLLSFFLGYEGKLIFHKADYDISCIIYTLWMSTKGIGDTHGLMQGLDVMTANFDDTKIIAYLSTNSTAGNVLGLKSLAHEFAGNWANDEIKDICRIQIDELLQYNLVDTLSTWYVYNKHYPIMVQDKQEELYKSLMLPSQKLIIQMEMTGMPMNKARIAEVRTKLETMAEGYQKVIEQSPIIAEMNLRVQTKAMKDANAKLKLKQHPLKKFAHLTFNPNSGPQLQVLLYEIMGLPVIDLTDTKQPATGADTLVKLENHAKDPAQVSLMQAIVANSKVVKILSTFIPAFEAGVTKAEDGIVWLFGSFNLGGTVSGRLSSSDPNLQNLPAGSIFGKLVKSIFMAPNGWIFAGADFNSLEDYISALTTKDPNKLKVYLEGFDGHCLRAAFYFRDQLPHIDLSDPNSVNTIKKTHPELRQDSKGPTFALTYQGTAHTLVNNLGWPVDKAKAVEANYHELYAVSDAYVQERLKQASKDGYVEVAFGLRVRTPLLAQVIYGSSRVPYEALAEGRTAGNALGQSYGLLNNRAAVAFWLEVWKSPYRYDILPVALIHDAVYVVLRDDPAVVEFANRELIKAMKWQELPEIQHPQVKLGAALDLFWPNWAQPVTLPNDATQEQMFAACQEHLKKLREKGEVF